MASSGMFDKAMRWARSPQGQRAIAKAQQVAKDPATRAKVQQLKGRAEQVAKDPATKAKLDQARERVANRGKRTPPDDPGTTGRAGTTPPRS
jgi:hypothetical protein